MCTVSYFPFGDSGFILTSNRDESPLRPMALMPSLQPIGPTGVLFPMDPQGGGTWIATQKHHTLCLLNGADKFHERKGPYRKSRGLILLDFFDYTDVDKFVSQHDFSSIEPFTLVIVKHNNRQLFQLRWNGQIMDFQLLDSSKPCIWSSFTLYQPTVILQRQQWFTTFLSSESIDEKSILNFHKFGGNGDVEQDLVMSRQGKVMTVSITQIMFGFNKHVMFYVDLRQNKSVTLHV